MKARLFTIFFVLLVLSVMLAPGEARPVAAQRPQPTSGRPQSQPTNPIEPNQNSITRRVTPQGGKPGSFPQRKSPVTTGGPDQFGYTWNDAVPFSWIDATGGTDTGMSGYSYGQRVYVSLPFAFRFYENTYSSIYIGASGVLGFTDSGYWPTQKSVIPSTGSPHNVIAPYWTPLYLSNTGPTGRVYYTSGGTAPNRYFVTEWYNVVCGPASDQCGGDDSYRFEAILWENGDIVFLYQAMTYNGWRYWGTAGIENSTGLDGLSYFNWGYNPASGTVVRFTRPVTARPWINPLNQGRFSTASAVESFSIPVINAGDLGTDTFNLTASSPWPISLYATDGVTPITNTGPVAQGSTYIVIAKITAPGGAAIGDSNTATVTARSTLDSTKQKTSTLQIAIPTRFAQVYTDSSDSAMSLYLVHPSGQAVRQTTPTNYYGYSPAVAEEPNGNFVYAWARGRCLGSSCAVYVDEIEYTLTDKYGVSVRSVTKLTDNSGATIGTYDWNPAVAVAPNGNIGILWYRDIYNGSTNQDNYNIYFAILDSGGNVVLQPTNLTNNSLWLNWDNLSLNVPELYQPQIVATGDNRFVLAWERYYWSSSTTTVSNVWYSVQDTSGTTIAGLTQLTGDNTSFLQSANSVTGNAGLVTWRTGAYPNYNLWYSVVSSAGSIVKVATNLSNNGLAEYYSDAVALSDGKTAVAWTYYNGVSNRDQLVFAILDMSYNPIAGPTTLINPVNPIGNWGISVAADSAGRAVITWMDNTDSNLYYTLVNSSGNVLTQPMIFRSSQITGNYIETSYMGYGNTSYSSTVPAGVDTWVQGPSSPAGGAPGGTASILIKRGNHGVTKATSVVVTATLSTGLTYVSDTSGVVPTVSGNTVTWNLPSMLFLYFAQFNLVVNVPNGPLGTLYPVTLTIASAGPEVNPSDNAASAQVVAISQLFLPLIRR